MACVLQDGRLERVRTGKRDSFQERSQTETGGECLREEGNSPCCPGWEGEVAFLGVVAIEGATESFPGDGDVTDGASPQP